MRMLHASGADGLPKILLVLALGLGLSAEVCAREQVVIQKGTNGNAQLRGGSLFLDENAPTTSTNTQLNVKAQNGIRQRSYVLFDFSSLPTLAVKGATLTLHVKTAPASTRSYGVHNVTAFSTMNANWTNRAIDSQGIVTAWGAPGGDFNGTATNAQNVTNASTTVVFSLTGDVQNWYDGTANYGTLIKDENEGNGGGNNVTTVFNSFSDATVANRPALTLTYLQNVTNAAAIPGATSVTVSWTYPTLLHPFNGETYNGVVILRRAGAPVDKNSFPADTQAPAAQCAAVGSGTVVYVGTATTFTDNGVCGGLTGGTQYFYKIFVRDSANYYSHNVIASTFTSEAAATPGTTQQLAWTLATHSYNLGGGGMIPGTQMVFGSDTQQLFSVNLTNGSRAYPAVGLGGTVSSRPPILDSTVAANGSQVAYIAAQDGSVYAIDTGATAAGQILWLTNLSATGTAGNIFMGGAGVQVKQYSSAAYTPTYDTVFVGTHNASTTTANSLVALNGGTGAILWTFTGSGANRLDMINSTPTVDYVNKAVWVTSHSNAVTSQPNLWKFNPLNNTVSWSVNLGNAGDIDSSPSLTQNGDVLFVGANNGNMYAVNPAAASSGTALLATYAGTDGAVKSYPYIVTTNNPYTVVFTTGTMVHAVSFDKNTSAFTKLWDSAAYTSPSAPVVYNSKIYFGTGSDIIYELDLSTGSVTGQRTVDTGNNPMFIGEPSLDLVLNRIYVTTTTNDQRSYAYTVPF